jgi:N-acetylmuramoyl-L-alanine amidase
MTRQHYLSIVFVLLAAAVAIALWWWPAGQPPELADPPPTPPPHADGHADGPSSTAGDQSTTTTPPPPADDPAPSPTPPPVEVDAPPASAAAPPPLSALAEPPDWTKLEAYQHTITRGAFYDMLSGVFTTGEAWRDFITIEGERAVIKTAGQDNDDTFILHFAENPDAEAPVPRRWRPGSSLPPATHDQPLADIHIAIDPGHLGGPWAKIEERWFSVDGQPPVIEGDMTLKVARMLKPALENLGARVTLVRDNSDPVTPLRPEMLLDLAREQAPPGAADSPAAVQRLAERLFYRTAEIRARADLVNQAIRPDLVLCLHFNAEAWGNPARPTLVDRTHFHLLLNGGYTDSEVALADQRFAMLHKLLQRTLEEEATVGATVADVFAAATGLPPFTYPDDSAVARQVAGHPFLWARNLLANRLYDAPVVFLEPYVMNSRQDHARIQAGDYDGLREIDGVMRPSIYREYVDALVSGLATHYRSIRPAADD